MGPGRSGSFSSMLISKVVGFRRAKTRVQFLWLKLALMGSSYLDPKCVLHMKGLSRLSRDAPLCFLLIYRTTICFVTQGPAYKQSGIVR